MVKQMTPQRVYEILVKEHDQIRKRTNFNSFCEYDMQEGELNGMARAMELLLQCEEVTDG